MMTRVLLLLLLPPAVFAQPGQQPRSVIFSTALNAITGVQASAPIQNVGQAMHLIKVEFPSAVAAVSPIRVRLEAAYICNDPPLCAAALWIPISYDISTAPLLDGTVYAFEKGYGVFPLIRVRSIISVPGGVGNMTVRYQGHLLPIVPFVTQLADRWVF